MKAKHTPGPWHYALTGERMRDSYSQPFGISEDGKPNLIAGVFGDVQGGEAVAKANAILITAAPDLLSACQQAKELLVPVLDGPGRVVFWNLCAAIRKATGEQP